MAFLLAIAAVPVGLVLLVLVLPFHARASGSLDEALSGAARIDWAWGFLSVDVGAGPVPLSPSPSQGEGRGEGGLRGPTLRLLGIPLVRLSGPRRRARRKPAKEAEEAPPQEERAAGRDRLRAMLRERGPLLHVTARLARALHLRLRLAGSVGTGDPADTALLGAFMRAVAGLPGVELALELDWVEEALDLDAECEARIWLAELLVVAALLLLDREHRAALRAVYS